jgi:hypothetical protein
MGQTRSDSVAPGRFLGARWVSANFRSSWLSRRGQGQELSSQGEEAEEAQAGKSRRFLTTASSPSHRDRHPSRGRTRARPWLSQAQLRLAGAGTGPGPRRARRRRASDSDSPVTESESVQLGLPGCPGGRRNSSPVTVTVTVLRAAARLVTRTCQCPATVGLGPRARPAGPLTAGDMWAHVHYGGRHCHLIRTPPASHRRAARARAAAAAAAAAAASARATPPDRGAAHRPGNAAARRELCY